MSKLIRLPPITINSESTTNTQEQNSSYLNVRFNTPLIIPNEAQQVFVSLSKIQIWNNFPNVSVLKNNNKIYYSDGVTSYNYTMDDGLYSITEIYTTLQRSLTKNGLPIVSIKFEPEYASGYLYIGLAQNYTIDFTQSDCPRDLLGFNSQILTGGVQGIATLIKADNVANFSDLSAVQIRSSLSTSNIDGFSSDVLITFPILSKNGFLYAYSPVHLEQTDGNKMKGVTRDCSFYITDQNGQMIVNTLPWIAVLNIEYTI